MGLLAQIQAVSFLLKTNHLKDCAMSNNYYMPRLITIDDMENGCEVDILLCQPPLTKRVKADDSVIKNYFDSMVASGSYLKGEDPYESNNGLLMLASVLRNHGLRVGYLDLHTLDLRYRRKEGRFLTKQDYKRLLSSYDYKILAISTITVAHNQSNLLARTSKEISSSTVCVGGLLPSSMSENMLNSEKCIDIAVKGSGIETLPHIVINLINGKDISTVPNITYRAEDGQIFSNNISHTNKSVKPPILPAYDLVPQDIPLIPRIETSLNCRGNCVFCSPNSTSSRKIFPQNYDFTIDATSIVRNIDGLCATYDLDFYLLGNLSLFNNSELDEKVCSYLASFSGTKREFWCQLRLDDITQKRCQLLKNAGCVQCAVGIETASENVLSRCGKHYGFVPSIEVGLSMLKETGICTYGYFIIGLPGESEKEVYATIELIDRLLSNNLLDGTHISVLVPYPGTPIFAHPERWGIKILTNDFSEYWMNCDPLGCGMPVYDTAYLSRERIYSLWTEALQVCTKHYTSRRQTRRFFNCIASSTI